MIDLGFDLPALDSFRLAVDEDYLAPGNTNLDYGITIAADLAAAKVPEPGSLALLAVGLAALYSGRHRRPPA